MILTITTVIFLGSWAWHKWFNRNKVTPEAVKVQVINQKPFKK